MQIIGLTGGIASGKSTCCKYLKSRGIPIIDTDKIALEVTDVKLIRKHFPSAIKEDKVDRIALGDLIFKDRESKNKLQRLIHPLIRRTVLKMIFYYWIIGTDRVILDVPLLFETNTEKFTSFNILIYVSKAIQLKRLMKRNVLSEQQALDRINSQWPIGEKVKFPNTIVIDNEGNIENTLGQLETKIICRKPNFFIHKILLHALPLCVFLATILTKFLLK